jgi:transposase
LLEGFKPKAVIADKGYDSQEIVDRVRAMKAKAVIPTLKSRSKQRRIDRVLYKARNVAERFWARVKQYRRVATRYEKTARNFLAFVQVASIHVLVSP